MIKIQVRQLLESIYIIENSKNIDTLSGRIDFINQIYNNFIPASQMKAYQEHVAIVLDEYKAMYYDRTPTIAQITLLLYPDWEKMRLFYSDSIFYSYQRYTEYQTNEMNKLKTAKAQERRREDIIKKGYDAKYMIKTYELPDVGHSDSIEEIRERFYSYRKDI